MPPKEAYLSTNVRDEGLSPSVMKTSDTEEKLFSLLRVSVPPWQFSFTAKDRSGKGWRPYGNKRLPHMICPGDFCWLWRASVPLKRICVNPGILHSCIQVSISPAKVYCKDCLTNYREKSSQLTGKQQIRVFLQHAINDHQGQAFGLAQHFKGLGQIRSVAVG